MQTTAKLNVGDWIRFLRGVELVIDAVAYIEPRASWERCDKAVTFHHGTVPLEHIQEVRVGHEPSGKEGR